MPSSFGSDNLVELLEETSHVEIVDSGFPGPRGASAYELAVAQGFAGTLADWIASIQGNQNVVILQHDEPLNPFTPPDTAVFRYRS